MSQIGITQDKQGSGGQGQRRIGIQMDCDSGGLGCRRLGQQRFRIVVDWDNTGYIGYWWIRIAEDWDIDGLLLQRFRMLQIGIAEVQDNRRMGQRRFRMAQIGIAKVQDAVDWDSTGFIEYWWIGIAEDRWIVIAESICAEWIDQRSLLNI